MTNTIITPAVIAARNHGTAKRRYTPLKSFRDIPKLVAMYRWMQEYERIQRYAPAIRELCDAGFSTSTSVVRYYILRMVDLNMLERDFGVSRGIRLLPLESADLEVVHYLKENPNV